MESNEIKKIIPFDDIWNNLEVLESRLLEVSSSSNEYLTSISQYLIKAGGKRFRPIVTSLAGKFGKEKDNISNIIDAGVCVELIHIGSLYHDDVIDNATTRRGVESSNSKWNSTLSILAGDYLLARSSELAAKNLGLESVKLLASTYAELVEGQTNELNLAFNFDQNIDDYLNVIEGKTASLIRTSARLGALASSSDSDVIEALSAWGWNCGIIFQISDDILDLTSDSATLGKPAGNDILEGTYTLPVLIALSKDRGKYQEILTDIREKNIDIENVLIEFTTKEIIDESKEVINEYFNKSIEAIYSLKNHELFPILENINNYLINRTN
jgi:heptaprenyl diphosphate synthase